MKTSTKNEYKCQVELKVELNADEMKEIVKDVERAFVREARLPGFRPGKPTSDFIARSLNKITLFGSFFLGIIACVPLILNAVSNGLLGAVSFSGSTLLIVVGVILETVRELEAQMTMRHYKGFLE